MSISLTFQGKDLEVVGVILRWRNLKGYKVKLISKGKFFAIG